MTPNESRKMICHRCHLSFSPSIVITNQSLSCPYCKAPISIEKASTHLTYDQSSSIPSPNMFVKLPGMDIIKILGKGGMGEVYKAWHHALKQEVAVKILGFFLTMDPDFVERFERESEALARLNHPNIVQFFTKGQEGQAYFYCMELVPGKTLEDYQENRKNLSVLEKCQIFQKICRGLHYAHQKNLIHRDIKPSNIMITPDLDAKISDFGLVRILGHQETQNRLTQTGMQMGTKDYIAPEQKKDSKNVDLRADIFSLGVMFYEILLGQIPEGRFPLPTQIDPSLDKRFDLLVEKALQPRPENRFTSAGEMENIFAQLVQDLSHRNLSKKLLFESKPEETESHQNRIQRIFTERKPKILIAEDDLDSAELLSEYIWTIFPKAELNHVENGQKVLPLALKIKPDMILLDVMMPIQDGVATCEEIRKHTSLSNLPVLIITAAFDNDTLKKKAYLAGADDFIGKPLSFEEINKKIKQMLTSKYYHSKPPF